MEVLGYKYKTEQEAINARKACADYMGLPKSPEDTTIYWVDYNEANMDTPIFWFIMYTEGVEVVLDQPTTFEVITE